MVPPLGEEDEGKGEPTYQEHIKDAEKNGHLGDTNDVATVGDSPRDWVDEPEEVGVACKQGGVTLMREAPAGRPAGPQRLVGEEEKRHGAKVEEAPLVESASVRAHEVGDDPYPGQKDVVDGRPADAAREAPAR